VGGGGSNGGASAGSRSASKVRKSSESQARILGAEDGKNGGTQNGNGTDSDGQLSWMATNNTTAPLPPMPKLAPSQTQYIPTQKPSKASGFKSSKASKTFTVTATQSPFGGRSRMGTQSPEYVTVTTDITVQEEKEAEPTSSASPTDPITPASPIYADYSGAGGRERIGHAE
jgi:hypothetical protein